MKYDDILHCPHHVSEKHPRMSLRDRAAQFSPFAALTGHEEAIRETARRTEEKVELGEDGRAVLDEKWSILRKRLAAGDSASLSVTYFLPDERKSGGRYVTAEGKVQRIREQERLLVLEGGREIPVEDILELSGELFQAWEDSGL